MLFVEISSRNQWQGQAMHICKVITEKERSLLADRFKHVFKQDICDNSNRIHVRSFVIVVKTEHAREYKGSPSVAFLCADLLWRGIVCEQEWVLRVAISAACQWHTMVQYCCDWGIKSKLLHMCFLHCQNVNEVILSIWLC